MHDRLLHCTARGFVNKYLRQRGGAMLKVNAFAENSGNRTVGEGAVWMSEKMV